MRKYRVDGSENLENSIHEIWKFRKFHSWKCKTQNKSELNLKFRENFIQILWPNKVKWNSSISQKQKTETHSVKMKIEKLKNRKISKCRKYVFLEKLLRADDDEMSKQHEHETIFLIHQRRETFEENWWWFSRFKLFLKIQLMTPLSRHFTDEFSIFLLISQIVKQKTLSKCVTMMLLH